MFIPLTYEDARSLYPDLAASIVRQQRQSKSVYRDLPPEDLKWGLDYAIRVQATSLETAFASLMSESDDEVPEKPARSIEERVEDMISRTHVTLRASKRNKSWHAKIPRDRFPDQIRARYEEAAKRDDEEDRRLAALSPAEREREAEDALRQLRGQPGFVEIRLFRR